MDLSPLLLVLEVADDEAGQVGHHWYGFFKLFYGEQNVLLRMSDCQVI
jgi:hypothetical protein